MKNRLRVGVVGCGIGQAHVWAFQSLPEQFEVLAICDVDKARAQKVAAEFDVPLALTDLAELCRIDDLDVIDICTPSFLHFSQVEQVLAVTRQMMAGQGPANKPDPRPHLLVTLLLHTGIKKQECMGIKLAHIDSSNPARPAVHIRYKNPRMQYKERRLGLPAGWTQTLANYRRIYEPQDYLFPCTPRNLEYVLTNVAKQADLPGGLSFEMLRWTCAVHDYQGRTESDRLRRKLGLSRMSWKETEPKIIRLAEPPL